MPGYTAGGQHLKAAKLHRVSRLNAPGRAFTTPDMPRGPGSRTCTWHVGSFKHLLVPCLSEKTPSICRQATRTSSKGDYGGLLNFCSVKAKQCSPALCMPAGSHQLQLASGSAAAPSDHNQDPGNPESGKRFAGCTWTACSGGLPQASKAQPAAPGMMWLHHLCDA